MANVHPSLVIGSSTEVIAGEKLIVTAGAIDVHIHFICPQQVDEALASGTTTMIGGGTGPAAGTAATTCTSSPFYMRHMLAATDSLPMNIGLTGKGNDAEPTALEDIIKAGALGLKLHEDWGSTPATITNSLDVADKYDIQVCSCVFHHFLSINRSEQGQYSYRHVERKWLCRKYASQCHFLHHLSERQVQSRHSGAALSTLITLKALVGCLLSSVV